MRIEKVLTRFPIMTVFTAIIFVFMTLWLGYTLFVQERIVTDWRMEVVGTGNVVPAGKTTKIQLFLKDINDNPITDANVSLWLDMPEMTHFIQKPMHHVEGGLYETETIFSMGGTWIGMVDVKKGANAYYNQFFVEVTGQIMSKEHRDPLDKFDFSQPYPVWLNMQLQ